MGSLRKRKANPELVASPELVTNPFVKKRNLEWRVSPPPLRNPERKRRGEGSEGRRDVEGQRPTGLTQVTATIAAGASEDAENQQPLSPPRSDRPPTSALIDSAQVQISDHLAYFSRLLAAHTLEPFPPRVPRLPVPRYSALYQRSLGSPLGAHFVVTQHDHPVAGPHYDLRLQINETSSCSWAIMYGLPGDPNARGRNGRAGGGAQRNATETRVHCLWNHLVETGGRETGSLIIWDAGEYEVLRPGRGWKQQQQPSSGSEGEGKEEEDGGWWDGLSQQKRLARAFAGRRIRLRLNGARLPRPYVVNICLTRDEDAAGRAKAARAGERPRRRRRAQPRPAPRSTGPDTSSSGEDGPDPDPNQAGGEEEDDYADGSKGKSAEGLTEMEKELRELEDEEVRRTNAYTGAVNTIGSVHQRKWFLSLDREACGFVRGIKDGRVWWDRAEDGEDEEGGEGGNRLKWPFYVRGPDHERSAVTGRLGGDVLKDEGVAGYVGRKGWRPILN